MNDEFLKIDSQHVVSTLEHVRENLNRNTGDVSLDFTSVRQANSADLRSLEQLLIEADEKKLKVLLRGVNVNFYKALKLAKLAARFTFVN